MIPFRHVFMFLSLSDVVHGDPWPIVVYRGLNSSCCERSTLDMVQQLKAYYPRTYIISPALSSSAEDDRQRSLFDSLDLQISQLCQRFADDKRLAEGFIGIGLSQGGLILRGVLERCNRPPMRRLITLGSPHGGFSRLPSCSLHYMKPLIDSLQQRVRLLKWLPDSWLCRSLQRLAEELAYSRPFQLSIIPAQYYRDPDRLASYRNIFLADINNEFEPRNATYKRNVESLEALVAVRFEQDALLYPSYSAWFAYDNPRRGKDFNITSLPIYQQDWIGLDKLHRQGKLELLSLPGSHLDFPSDYVNRTLSRYISNKTV